MDVCAKHLTVTVPYNNAHIHSSVRAGLKCRVVFYCLMTRSPYECVFAQGLHVVLSVCF